MDVVRDLTVLRATAGDWREAGQRIGLVPTSGELHDGHISLARAARGRVDRVIFSILPRDPEDGRVRDEVGDLATIAPGFADLAFVPDAEDFFPLGFATHVHVGRFHDMLCTAEAHDLYDAPARRILKLLNLAVPDEVYFGACSWQATRVIEQMVRDLDLVTELIVCPVVREADGLPLSAAAARLGEGEREIAPRLFAELTEAARRIAAGEPTELACFEAQDNLIIAGFDKVEYLECRDAETLRLTPAPGAGARVFGAAHLGGVRLMDNVAVETGKSR